MNGSLRAKVKELALHIFCHTHNNPELTLLFTLIIFKIKIKKKASYMQSHLVINKNICQSVLIPNQINF